MTLLTVELVLTYYLMHVDVFYKFPFQFLMKCVLEYRKSFQTLAEVTQNGNEQQRMLTMRQIVAAILGPVCQLSLCNTESNFVANFSPGSFLFCPSLCLSVSVPELPSSSLCMRKECGSIVWS